MNTGDMKRIVLYGGGLDSTALALSLASTYGAGEIELLHIDYGQKATPGERAAQERMELRGFPISRLSLDINYSNASIMTPGIATERAANVLELRNPLLVAFAASYAASTAERSMLYLGFHYEPDNTFPDAGAAWLSDMQDVFATATHKSVLVVAPFSSMPRREVFATGIALEPQLASLAHTCYEAIACGQCTHCLELAALQQELGVWEPSQPRLTSV